VWSRLAPTRIPQRLARIVFHEVDRLGDVRVGLAPVLPDLVDLPGSGPELAAAQDVGGAQQYRRAFLRRYLAPRLEGAAGSLDSQVDFARRRLLADGDSLGL